MSTKVEGFFALTEPVLMLWPALFEPKGFQFEGKDRGEPKYSATFIIGPANPQWEGLKKHVAAICHGKFGNYDGMKELFKRCDEVSAAQIAAGKNPLPEITKGKLLFRLGSKEQPRLAGVENGVMTDYRSQAQMAAAKSKFFSGAEVLIQANFVAGRIQGRNMVWGYLNNVAATGHGTRIGGDNRPASQVFSGYRGTTSAEDPTAGMSDEIPF